ncbi:hypothetical protein NQZ68_014498 [Dissostichus eleginoides]|nr:hypothetical protein NQZ68_014498 [Dissostichus eleginoides]
MLLLHRERGGYRLGERLSECRRSAAEKLYTPSRGEELCAGLYQGVLQSYKYESSGFLGVSESCLHDE